MMTFLMRSKGTPFLFSGALLIAAGAGLALFEAFSRPSSPQSVAPLERVSKTAVVLELFTSQGCSSCPPADRLLSALGQDETLQNQVIPLAYHVDYWNHIGWRDPFSSAAWSDRQGDYAQALQTGRLYTPQLVVNGRRALVGSDERQARSAITKALADPTAATVQLSAIPAQDRTDRVHIGVAVTFAAPVAVPMLDVMVALFENNLATDVRSGENARRRLQNDHVVRHLERSFALATDPDVRQEKQITLDLPPGADQHHLGVAVFLQDPASMHIYGASTVLLSAL